MYAFGAATAAAYFAFLRHDALKKHRNIALMKDAADVSEDCRPTENEAGWSYHDGSLWYSNGHRECAVRSDGIIKQRLTHETALAESGATPAPDAPVAPPPPRTTQSQGSQSEVAEARKEAPESSVETEL